MPYELPWRLMPLPIEEKAYEVYHYFENDLVTWKAYFAWRLHKDLDDTQIKLLRNLNIFRDILGIHTAKISLETVSKKNKMQKPNAKRIFLEELYTCHDYVRMKVKPQSSLVQSWTSVSRSTA